MKKSAVYSSIVFLIFVLILSALLYYFFPDSFQPSHTAKIGDVLKCQTEKLSPKLKELRIEEDGKLQLILSFHNKPSEEEVVNFAAQGIELFPNTWIFDYLVAETDYSKICALVNSNNVSYIDIYDRK